MFLRVLYMTRGRKGGQYYQFLPMTNEELAQFVVEWREAAAQYRQGYGEVRDPVASALRLEHLIGQLETIIKERVES